MFIKDVENGIRDFFFINQYPVINKCVAHRKSYLQYKYQDFLCSVRAKGK